MTSPSSLDSARLDRLGRELRTMLADMPAAQVRSLALECARDLGRTTARRVTGTGELLARVSRRMAREAVAASLAGRERRLRAHLTERSQAFVGAANDVAQDAARAAGRLRIALRADPAEALVQTFLFSMTALIASARARDGSADDTGDRRTRLLNTSLLGAPIETLCLTAVRIINTSHRYLPHGHDAWWDLANARCRPHVDHLDRGLDMELAHRLLAQPMAPDMQVPAGN